MSGLAERYDEAAWAAQDRGSDAEYEVFYRRARAAAAVAFAHREDAGNAVYEAAHAFGDTDRFADALRAALRGTTHPTPRQHQTCASS